MFKLDHYGVLNFHIIFILIYSIFNLLGIYNFSFYAEELRIEVFYIFFVGLVGFIIGMFISRILFKKKYSRNQIITIKNFNKKFLIIYFIYFIVILLIAIYQNKNGIIFLNKNARFDNSAIATLLTLFFSLLVFYYYTYYKLNKLHLSIMFKISIILYMLILLSYGYRGPIITLFMVLGFISFFLKIKIEHYHINKNTILKLFIFALSVIIFAVVVEYIRLTQQYDYLSFFKNMNLDNSNTLIILLIPFFALLRHDQEVSQKLFEYFQTNDFFNFSLMFSNLETLLPGDQLGVRNIIGSIVTERVTDNGKPWSITATIQGNLYADFGYVGVFLGFLTISVFMYYLRNLLVEKVSIHLLVLYAYISVGMIKSIHAGYADASTYIMFIVIFLMHFYSKLKVTK